MASGTPGTGNYNPGKGAKNPTLRQIRGGMSSMDTIAPDGTVQRFSQRGGGGSSQTTEQPKRNTLGDAVSQEQQRLKDKYGYTAAEPGRQRENIAANLIQYGTPVSPSNRVRAQPEQYPSYTGPRPGPGDPEGISAGMSATPGYAERNAADKVHYPSAWGGGEYGVRQQEAANRGLTEYMKTPYGGGMGGENIPGTETIFQAGGETIFDRQAMRRNLEEGGVRRDFTGAREAHKFFGLEKIAGVPEGAEVKITVNEREFTTADEASAYVRSEENANMTRFRQAETDSWRKMGVYDAQERPLTYNLVPKVEGLGRLVGQYVGDGFNFQDNKPASGDMRVSNIPGVFNFGGAVATDLMSGGEDTTAPQTTNQVPDKLGFNLPTIPAGGQGSIGKNVGTVIVNQTEESYGSYQKPGLAGEYAQAAYGGAAGATVFAAPVMYAAAVSGQAEVVAGIPILGAVVGVTSKFAGDVTKGGIDIAYRKSEEIFGKSVTRMAWGKAYAEAEASVAPLPYAKEGIRYFYGTDDYGFQRSPKDTVKALSGSMAENIVMVGGFSKGAQYLPKPSAATEANKMSLHWGEVGETWAEKPYSGIYLTKGEGPSGAQLRNIIGKQGGRVTASPNIEFNLRGPKEKPILWKLNPEGQYGKSIGQNIPQFNGVLTKPASTPSNELAYVTSSEDITVLQSSRNAPKTVSENWKLDFNKIENLPKEYHQATKDLMRQKDFLGLTVRKNELGFGGFPRTTYGVQESTHDVDWMLTKGDAATKAKQVVNAYLNVPGGPGARVNPSMPNLVETKINGKWTKTWDIHDMGSTDLQAAANTGYYGGGFKVRYKSTSVEGVPMRVLSEESQALHGAATMYPGITQPTEPADVRAFNKFARVEYFARGGRSEPAEHRLKDVVSNYWSKDMLADWNTNKGAKLTEKAMLGRYEAAADVKFMGVKDTAGFKYSGMRGSTVLLKSNVMSSPSTGRYAFSLKSFMSGSPSRSTSMSPYNVGISPSTPGSVGSFNFKSIVSVSPSTPSMSYSPTSYSPKYRSYSPSKSISVSSTSKSPPYNYYSPSSYKSSTSYSVSSIISSISGSSSSTSYSSTSYSPSYSTTMLKYDYGIPYASIPAGEGGSRRGFGGFNKRWWKKVNPFITGMEALDINF